MTAPTDIGYDPRVTAPRYGGAQTLPQWVADMATSLTLQFLNGASMTQPEMADTWWAQHGIAKLGSFGAASGHAGDPNYVMDASTYNTMLRVAQIMAQEGPLNPDGSHQAPITLPDIAPIAPTTAGQIAGQHQQDTVNATSAANNAANNATSTANNAANNAQSAANTAADNAARIEAQRLANQGSVDVANIRATTDREATAANERIATGDRTSRETIAANSLKESSRQFDITTAEGARQFNATALTSLLQIGVQLAQKPVDWIGYQYFMNNVGIPMNPLTATSMVSLLGAVPPTGPSATGPVTGGPGVIHGDTSLAQAANVTPAFVSVADAVQQNPGDTSAHPGLAPLTAQAKYPEWVQQAGGAEQLEQQVSQARTQEVMPALQQQSSRNPMVNALLQSAGPLGTNQLRNPAGALPQLPGVGTPTNVPGGSAMNTFGKPTYIDGQPVEPQLPSVTAQVNPYEAAHQVPQIPGPSLPPLPSAPQSYPVGGMQPIQPTAGGVGALPPVQTPMQAPPGSGVSAPGVMVGDPNQAGPPVANVTTGGNTGTGNTGIYTGTPTPQTVNTQTGAAAPTSTSGANTPQGADLVHAIANSLGIPYEQATQLINPALMAGGYSPQQIAQTPVIQGLQHPDSSFGPAYRTAPVGDSKFGQIGAFGIPLNIRGGQDINSQSFLNTSAANRDMVQGAVEATGQNWADVQNQMFRSSPLTNIQAGAFGRRVY